MRSVAKHAAISLSILLVAACFPDGHALAADDADRFVWLDNLDEARLIAKTRQQPLLIVFRCEP